LKLLLIRLRVPLALPIAVLPEVLARVVPWVLLRVVKAPVLAVEAPIAVELMPVALAVKLDDVMLSELVPALIVEALRPLRFRVPLVAVRLAAPVVRVSPLEAVNVWVTVNAPALVVVIPLLPRVIAVAVLVPRDKVPAEATSTEGVRTEVPAYRVAQALVALPRFRVLLALGTRDWLIEVALRLDRAVLA
jgi:hypothetical protein